MPVSVRVWACRSREDSLQPFLGLIIISIVASLSLLSGDVSAQVVTEFSLRITNGPYGIAAGPDGNLWFTELFGNRIGRITPQGVVTEFGAGIKAGAAPLGITTGPDGNLWFTEYGGDRIGRITNGVGLELFVTNSDSNSVTVHARTASGNVAPLRTLAVRHRPLPRAGVRFLADPRPTSRHGSRPRVTRTAPCANRTHPCLQPGSGAAPCRPRSRSRPG